MDVTKLAKKEKQRRVRALTLYFPGKNEEN